MQILKIWQLSSLIFLTCLYEFIAGVELQSCLHPLKSEPCNLTCQVPDFSKAVQIKCNGTLRGSCSVFGCGANMTQDGGTTVLYKISSLSYINDICDWTCTYGSSSSSALYIPVYSGYSIAPSLTSQQNGDVVNLTATAECLFPSNPNVVVQYKEQGGQYISLSQLAVELQSSSGQGVCSFDIENRITAISDVSGRLTGLGGKSVVFRMKFLQYADAMPAYTNDEGPFYFNKSEAGCNYSDTELFFGGFSCFLIVLITTIIMLIILACKMLPKIFGDLSTKKKTIKIIIIVVFIVVALIIGLALGFGLKECNQRNLGLGLGLGLGFLLAIALVVTLFIYHRQCDSKKENEDENRELPTEIQSKTPEDNHKRVGSPASASNVKMESKLNS